MFKINPFIAMGNWAIFFNEEKQLTKAGKIAIGVGALLVATALVVVAVVVL